MIEKLFLSVGAMKAGTTWLRHQLADHPEIFFTPEKEIHYFADPDGDIGPMLLTQRVDRFKRVMRNVNAERLNDRVRGNIAWYGLQYLAGDVSPEWYEELFTKKQDWQYAADFSNLYCLLDASQWGLVRQLAKEIRVVYSLRSPIHRLWSHLKFHNVFAGLDAPNPNMSEADWIQQMNSPGILPFGDYSKALNNLQNNLHPHELKVMFFEQVREDPGSALMSIEEFLGIEKRAYSKQRLGAVINATAPSPIPENLRRAALTYHKQQTEAVKKMGLDVPEAWLLKEPL